MDNEETVHDDPNKKMSREDVVGFAEDFKFKLKCDDLEDTNKELNQDNLDVEIAIN